jgi:uncharacterized protein YndB with AHSA1/START domain
VYSTRVSAHVNAPRPAVYQALLDADAVAKWRVPEGMTSHVHEFDAREGGSFRISLSYDAPGTGQPRQARRGASALSPEVALFRHKPVGAGGRP